MTISYDEPQLIVANYEFAYNTTDIGTGVQFNAQTIPLGAVYLFGQVVIEQQFNASGTDLLNIGITAGGGDFGVNLNLDQAAGTIIPLTAGFSISPLSASRNLFARYIGASTPASQGRAHISMFFILR